MELHLIDPLTDIRWADLAASHPKASAYHQPAWLKALADTYGYQFFAVTGAPEGRPLTDGIVFSRVASWITGIRAVSLPFSDHCEPLLDGVQQLSYFTDWLVSACDRSGWKYVELRPCSWTGVQGAFQPSKRFCVHTLDLSPSLEQLFRNLHRDSIQRKVLRAEREKLTYESGRSDHLIDDFYRLQLETRRRHRLPPQPRAWFDNIVKYLGADSQIRVARKDGVSIAAMMTLRHRSSVVYKYGCSREESHNLGGMPYLFWKVIEESKVTGANGLDFGRSDLHQKGLITFKDRFGTRKMPLSYFRYPGGRQDKEASNWGRRSMGKIVSLLPDRILSVVGRVLYKHAG